MMRNRPSIGIALGSGVARGWAHIGVLRALEEAGIEADAISGTSIGALVGGVYLADKMDILEDWARGLNRMRMLRLLDLNFSGGGLLGGDRLAKVLRTSLADVKIEELPKKFIPVCTELETGHEIWVRDGDLVDALRAAYALPGVFPPVEAYGFHLVDGALVNPVPTSVCRALGSRLVIAVDLNADLIGRSRPRRPDPGKEVMIKSQSKLKQRKKNFASQMLASLIGKEEEDGPGVFNVMASSLNILQDRVSRARMAGDPPDVVITPHVGHIGLMEFDRAEEAIEAGRAAVVKALPEIKTAREILEI